MCLIEKQTKMYKFIFYTFLIGLTKSEEPQPTQRTETNFQPIKYQAQPQYQPQYQTQPQPQTQPQYVQIVPKQYYQQPQAMIIIAQPAFVPQSLLYGPNPMMQLLHYFQNNPQVKNQLLYGNNFILQPQPQYVRLQAQSQPQSQPQPQQVQVQPQLQQQYVQPTPQPRAVQPQPLGHLAHLAQLAAQQYAASPTRVTPPIVTGFENFTPEQQAQIKAQLGAKLGANFHAITTTKNAVSDEYVQTSKPEKNSDEKN